MLFYGTEDFMEFVDSFDSQKEMFERISKILKKEKFKSYYYRIWTVALDDGEYQKIDYGSHTKFFFIRDF